MIFRGVGERHAFLSIELGRNMYFLMGLRERHGCL